MSTVKGPLVRLILTVAHMLNALLQQLQKKMETTRLGSERGLL